tara:strand:+ start:462 stop:779 length:318 start_codon:yes stop_codon:yes gene_type:complete
VKHGAVPISSKKIIKNGENDVLCRFNYRHSCWNYGRSYNMVYFGLYARLKKFSAKQYGANLELYSVGRLVAGIIRWLQVAPIGDKKADGIKTVFKNGGGYSAPSN